MHLASRPSQCEAPSAPQEAMASAEPQLLIFFVLTQVLASQVKVSHASPVHSAAVAQHLLFSM